MNEEGVLVMLHDEKGLPAKGEGGFWPRIAAVRIAIEKARAATAVQDVAEALRGKPPLVGCSVHVSLPLAKGKAGPMPSVIEWDGNALTEGVTIRPPEGDAAAGSVICTNHYLKRREPKAGAGTRQRAALQGPGRCAGRRPQKGCGG